jgi:hypothetical protein
MIECLHPCVPELKIRDYGVYQALLCGICSELREEYGFLASRFLCRDVALVALLSDGLAGREGTSCRGWCPFRPFGRRSKMCHTMGIRRAARMNVLLVWHELDSAAHEKRFSLWMRLRSAAACALLRGAYRRAAEQAAPLERLLRQERDHAQALALAGCSSYDNAAEPMANFFGALMMYCAPSDSAVRALRRVGESLGKIYFLLWQAQDYVSAQKQGRYNVFRQNGLDFASSCDSARRQCNAAAAALAGGYNLLDMKFNRALVDNMVFLGLENAVANVGASRAARGKEK